MTRAHVAALALALPLLVWAPAFAQRVLPTDPPIVLPPLGPQLRDAERAAERAKAVSKEQRLEPGSPVDRERPRLDYDVTTGIQQRAIEKTQPR